MSGGTITLSATALQQALFPFAAAMELAHELDERGFETFIEIACTRIASEASRLKWWET